MINKVRKGACIFFYALIITIAACASPGNTSSYIHTSYSDFIQGNGDGNIVFTGDGEIALSKQVGTAVGGFKLIGQLPYNGWSALTAARGCLYCMPRSWNRIDWTSIAQDGSLGDWHSSEPMPYYGTSRPSVAVIGDYIYVAGDGWTGESTGYVVQRAKLNPDGSVAGPWTEVAVGTGPLLSASGRLYATAGSHLAVADADAWGDLSDWRLMAGTEGADRAGVNILNNRIYATYGSPLHGIRYGDLGENGVADTLAEAFTGSANPYYVPSTIACGGCLFGFVGPDPLQNLDVMNGVASMLDDNGGPQARHPVAPLPSAFGYAGTASWGNYIYVAGGLTRSGQKLGDIYAAKVIEDGVPGLWTETSALPYALTHHQLVASGSHVYAIGGSRHGSGEATVLRAPILGNGQLGAWLDSTPLPVGCYHHAAIRHGDFTYVAGGVGSAGRTLSSVSRARILADGSLGEWEQQTPLPEPAWGHGLVVNDGYLYCVYGSTTDDTNPGAESPLYSAPILRDGSIGDWQKVSRLPASLVRDASAIVNGRLYVIGGEWYSEVVYSAPLAAGGGVGEWSRQPDLPYSIKGHGALAYDGSIYVIGGDMSFVPNSYPNVYDLPAGNIIYRGTPDAGGNIGQWEMLAPTPHSNEFRTGAALAGDTIYFVGGGPLSEPTNKAYFSRIHGPDTQVPTVSGGRYVGMFRLTQDEPMVSLHWIGDFGEGSGSEVRYRAAAQGDAVFGPWSEFSAANPLPIGQTASFLQYEVQLESMNGNPAAVDSIRLVTDTTAPTITVSATPNVLWPPSGRLIPVTINGSCTDTESGVESVKISITDEYGQPCQQATHFGQTVRLRASREATDRDGRAYIIRVTATDCAGNESKAYALVVCPHDLANIRKLPRRWQ